jgi:hypothetical protein
MASGFEDLKIIKFVDQMYKNPVRVQAFSG